MSAPFSAGQFVGCLWLRFSCQPWHVRLGRILQRLSLRLPKNFVAQTIARLNPARLSTNTGGTGFRDPTLNRLIQIAYNQNLTLESAGTRVLQARAVLGIAIGITYPQVQQGVGSVIYNRTSAATPLAGPNATPSYFWTDALAAQAAWELDFWGKFRRGVESADGVYLASIASL